MWTRNRQWKLALSRYCKPQRGHVALYLSRWKVIFLWKTDRKIQASSKWGKLTLLSHTWRANLRSSRPILEEKMCAHWSLRQGSDHVLFAHYWEMAGGVSSSAAPKRTISRKMFAEVSWVGRFVLCVQATFTGRMACWTPEWAKSKSIRRFCVLSETRR